MAAIGDYVRGLRKDGEQFEGVLLVALGDTAVVAGMAATAQCVTDSLTVMDLAELDSEERQHLAETRATLDGPSHLIQSAAP